MMPENATWDDLIHEIYVREVIERGVEDSKAGRTTDVREVRAKYGLSESEAFVKALRQRQPSKLSENIL